MAILAPLMHTMENVEATRKIEEPQKGCCQSCCDYSEFSTPRDVFWDNYKGLAQLFVVCMHMGALGMFLCAESYFDSLPGRLNMGFCGFIFLFTMPGFCFITGFFSSDNQTRSQRINLVRFVVVWMIQHGITVLLGLQQTMTMKQAAWHAEHPDVNVTNAALKEEGEPPLHPPGLFPVPVFQTVGLDWYLWCVIIWRCFLPLISQVRQPLTVSLMLAIGMMFTDTASSTYSNAPFGFLPFFLAGFLAKEKKAELRTIQESMLGRVIFVLVGVIVTCSPLVDTQMTLYSTIARNLGCLYGGDLADQLNFDITKANMTDLMRHPKPYPKTGYCQTGTAAMQILMLYAVAMSLILALMGLVPRKRVWLLTRAGANSIYIYLGQIWPIMVCMIGLIGLANAKVTATPFVAVLLSYLSVAGTWVLLSQPCFKCCCRPCIEPKVERGCVRLGDV